MRTQATVFRTVFIAIGIAVIGIWLALLLTGYLGVIGNLIFLGGAAWVFELYSATQKEGFTPKRPDAARERTEVHRFEEHA